MYKEIFNYPFIENSNRHMNEGLTVECVDTGQQMGGGWA
jgi:hypothetical protein